MEPLLPGITGPDDLKKLGPDELERLCAELRDHIITSVSRSGGHLGASLGVVELTVALHRVFSTPRDKIVWDVGHQAYGHKLLTGRLERFGTLRRKGGIAGFAKGGADVKLEDDGAGGTVLTYTAKADVGGKMAQLGSRLILSTSKKLAGQFFSSLNEKISNG